MKSKLNCIMLVDDNQDDNFFHEREIKKNNPATIVITKNNAMSALEYLKSAKDKVNLQPDLILLDINMPGMNGWEFLQEYNLLAEELQGRVIIIMLTTSENSDDIEKAKSGSFVSDFITKPMTKDIMKKLIEQYFK